MNDVQNWIDTSDNSFAVSLRSQQAQGRTLSERQLAAAANIVAGVSKPAPASVSRHVGTVGETAVAEVAQRFELQAKSTGNIFTKILTPAGDELVFFGRLTDSESNTLSFVVREHSQWAGKLSTVIARPQWVLAPEAVDLTQANTLLASFRAAPPVIKPESKTPFADFASQLKK